MRAFRRYTIEETTMVPGSGVWPGYDQMTERRTQDEIASSVSTVMRIMTTM